MTDAWEMHPETGLNPGPLWRDRGTIIANLTARNQALEERVAELELAALNLRDNTQGAHEREQALRERLTALADRWESVVRAMGPRATYTGAEAVSDCASDLRAALAASPAVDATPEPTCMALREGRTCDLGSGHVGDHQHQTVRGMRTWSDRDRAGTETASDEPSVGPAREGDCDSVPACTCGSPDAYSLNPAEAVVHRSDGPCFIAPVDTATPAAEPQAEGGALTREHHPDCGIGGVHARPCRDVNADPLPAPVADPSGHTEGGKR